MILGLAVKKPATHRLHPNAAFLAVQLGDAVQRESLLAELPLGRGLCRPHHLLVGRAEVQEALNVGRVAAFGHLEPAGMRQDRPAKGEKE